MIPIAIKRNGMLRYIAVALPLFVTGCVATGEDGLLANSRPETIEVIGDYRAVSYCVTKALDNERFAVGEVPARVTRTIESQGGRALELQSANPAALSVLFWEAEFLDAPPGKTLVTLHARTTDDPFLPTNYFPNKMHKAIVACAGKV